MKPMLIETDINKLSETVHTWAVDVGWWDNKDRCPFETLQLFSTEVAEATEGERKQLMDDPLPNRPMGEVELADVVIRAVDMAGHYGWIYSATMRPRLMYYGEKTIGAMHLSLNKIIIQLADSFHYDGTESASMCSFGYSVLIEACYYIAFVQGYDIDGAIVEKIEYNRTRADHKRENRSQTGGKGF